MRPLSSTLSRSYSTPTTQEPKTTSKPPTPSSPPSAEKSNPKHRTNQPPSQNHPSPPRLIKRILHIRRVARVNSGGKVRSVSALVVVGNGNGAAGYGEGRAVEVSAAVQKATRNAEKNMTYFERFNHRTIFSNIDFYWHRVRLQLRSAPPGYGVVASNHIHEICRCIGISDLGAKVYGSRNPMNVIKATFEALKRQKKPEDIAKARGKKVHDVEMTYYGYADKGK